MQLEKSLVITKPHLLSGNITELMTDRSDFLRATAAQLLGSLNDVPLEVRQRLAQVGCELSLEVAYEVSNFISNQQGLCAIPAYRYNRR